MGRNNPLPSHKNPLFATDEVMIQDRDDAYLTLVMKTITTQLLSDDSVQSDQGANISITPERYLLRDYVSIVPFKIGHASKNSPPLMAIGKGKMQIKTKDGDSMYTSLYHVPRASGNLLSPDFVCT